MIKDAVRQLVDAFDGPEQRKGSARRIAGWPSVLTLLLCALALVNPGPAMAATSKDKALPNKTAAIVSVKKKPAPGAAVRPSAAGKKTAAGAPAKQRATKEPEGKGKPVAKKGPKAKLAVAKKPAVRAQDTGQGSVAKKSAAPTKRVATDKKVATKKTTVRQKPVAATKKKRTGKSTARADRGKRSTTAPSPAKQVLATEAPAAGVASSPNAQFERGLRYYFGEGVRVDKKEAARWFSQAAGQGHVDAQSNLAWLYARGEGVAVNKAEAYRWWKKAADQGNSLARHNLDSLCRDNPAACKGSTSTRQGR